MFKASQSDTVRTSLRHKGQTPAPWVKCLLSKLKNLSFIPRGHTKMNCFKPCAPKEGTGGSLWLAGQVASQPTIRYLESSKIVKDTVSKTDKKPGVAHAFNPNTGGRGRQMALSSRSAWSTQLVPGQPWRHVRTCMCACMHMCVIILLYLKKAIVDNNTCTQASSKCMPNIYTQKERKSCKNPTNFTNNRKRFLIFWFLGANFYQRWFRPQHYNTHTLLRSILLKHFLPFFSLIYQSQDSQNMCKNEQLWSF